MSYIRLNRAYNTVCQLHAEGRWSELVQHGPTLLEQVEGTASGIRYIANARAMVADGYMQFDLIQESCVLRGRSVFDEGHEHYTRNPLILRVSLASDLSKLARHRDSAEVVRPIAVQTGEPSDARAMAFRVLASATWHLTGDLGAATELLEQSSVAAGRGSGAGLWWKDAFYRGQFLVTLDRAREALGVLQFGVGRQREQYETSDKSDPHRANLGLSLASLARAEIALMMLDEARSHLDEAAALVPEQKFYGQVAVSRRRAELALADLDLERATDDCERALLASRARGFAGQEADCLQLFGRILQTDGDSAGAKTAYLAARELHEAHATPLFVAQCDAALARL